MIDNIIIIKYANFVSMISKHSEDRIVENRPFGDYRSPLEGTNYSRSMSIGYLRVC